jgi:hypothetical protein
MLKVIMLENAENIFFSLICHGTIWPKGHNLASSFGGG